MRIYGINDSSHDAALSIVEDGEIVFAAHSERYNKQKNTFYLDRSLLDEALQFGPPDIISYFEKRNLKWLRRMMWGGINGDYSFLYKKMHKHVLNARETQVKHHRSHAAAGYFTSCFEDATIVVLDAIGEIETASIWDASGPYITQRESFKYPFSFGLFYSAFTNLVGLKAGTEEYILMGMAAYGDKRRFFNDVESYFPRWDLQTASFHTGVPDWPHPIETEQDKFDIAAAAQFVYTLRLIEFMQHARRDSKSTNLVFMGGCALNCLANTKLLSIWEEVWIMPNPGDAGSSLGAALSIYGHHVEWQGPYLGHDIGGPWPVQEVYESLILDGLTAVASGRAEFGPRSLGNRSLLADPSSIHIKERVNDIKHREQFRPFAPVVMEDHVHDWFDIDRPSPYMQYAVKCLQPDRVPGIVHRDGTSRVQTVNELQHPDLYQLLKKWHEETGIPMLLNTSLNIKGQPIINDSKDAEEWQRRYGREVHTIGAT
jgi:carbamoyltransferase